MVGQADQPGVAASQFGADGRRVCLGADRQGAKDRLGVLAALAGQQPAAVHAQQLGQFIDARQRDATVEPVVDVLGRDIALRGEVGRGQVAFFQEGLEAVAGCLHATESSG